MIKGNATAFKGIEQDGDFMILGIIILSISQGILISYLVFMANAGIPTKFTSPIHFALALFGLIVSVASFCWGIGNLQSGKRRNGILSIVLSSLAFISFFAVLFIDYVHYLNFPLFL